MDVPPPVVSLAIKSNTQADEEKLGHGLQKLPKRRVAIDSLLSTGEVD